MLLALVIVPLALGVIAFAIRSARLRPWMIPLGGTAHALLTLFFLVQPPSSALNGWLVLDPLGKVVLGFVSLLYLLCSFYVPGYLALRPERKTSIFCGALLAFLAAMSLMILSHHLGLMWVAIEGATLSSAPLLYFNRNQRSLEATWKYLLIGSVGIALALFGSFFLAYSALQSGMGSSLLFEDLVREAPRLSIPWLHAAFVILLVGYGTKMGLAPMHTWKPDAYGEAPGLVGALLAGGLTNGAFLAILRFVQICNAAGEGAFARHLLVVMGLVSMAVAGVFMAGQRDYKRMLAYSSVEHMGILVFGIGIGGLGTFGALLHLINNGLGKGLLFLSAGNIHRAYGSKLTDQVTGALRLTPASGALFLAGFFAITGSPPFGPFMSEFTILNAAITGGRFASAGLFLLMLAIVFIGMGATVLRVVQGEPSAAATSRLYKERILTVAPAIAFLILVVLMGVYIPPPVSAALRDAASFLELKHE
jgi:hydrogenase-4 component F